MKRREHFSCLIYKSYLGQFGVRRKELTDVEGEEDGAD